MVSISDFDLGWLVGIFEGEGCFSTSKSHGYDYPMISISSTDKDVLVRVRSILDTGTVRGPFTVSKSSYGNKPIWRLDIKCSKARKIMEIMKPHMCIRRQSRIEEVLSISR